MSQVGSVVRASTAAVIVTYNRKSLLCQCLSAVLDQEGASCDALIIDNASADGTGDFVKSTYAARQDVIYINTGQNLGGAGGFQVGVREAVQRGYANIWLMDDDTIPEKTALIRLLDAGKKLGDSWGCLSSVAYWTDGSICGMNIQKKTIFRHVGASAYQKEWERIAMCSFVSLLVKASVVKEVGLPIGEYFVWTDDYEFTGRISSRYPCYMVPSSRVTHAMVNNIRVNFVLDTGDRLKRYRYIYRNDVHCYRRYGMRGWAYILLKDLYTALNILLFSKGEKKEKLKVLYQGFKEGLSFSPACETWDGEAFSCAKHM